MFASFNNKIIHNNPSTRLARLPSCAFNSVNWELIRHLRILGTGLELTCN